MAGRGRKSRAEALSRARSRVLPRARDDGGGRFAEKERADFVSYGYFSSYLRAGFHCRWRAVRCISSSPALPPPPSRSHIMRAPLVHVRFCFAVALLHFVREGEDGFFEEMGMAFYVYLNGHCRGQGNGLLQIDCSSRMSVSTFDECHFRCSEDGELAFEWKNN